MLRRARGDLQHARHVTRQILLTHHRVERELPPWELADRDGTAVEHERWQHDVDAAAIGEPRVNHRARLVDPASDSGGNTLCNIDEMLSIAKPSAGLF
jgi:hypothetical protein